MGESGAGTMQFGPVEVAFDTSVLVPRQWTLLQSQWAAELTTGLPDGPLLELCAGVGHIGLAAAVLSGRDLVLVDVSPVATAFARANADGAGWADRTEIRCGRLDSALREDERWPLVLADPPYLPSAETSRFPEDPALAVDGGEDGLDLVRLCLTVAATHLLPGCPLLLQVAGAAQAEEVAALSAGHGLVAGEVRSFDPERAVMLLRRPPET